MAEYRAGSPGGVRRNLIISNVYHVSPSSHKEKEAADVDAVKGVVEQST